MLKFVIISMILATGLVTFPAQASRPATPTQVQFIPQQIPGNEAQIVENDTTVQARSIPRRFRIQIIRR